MLVGTCWIEMFLHGNSSLKGKRRVVKSIKDRLRKKFNISISEIAKQDSLERIVLGIAIISNEQGFIHSSMSQIIDAIDSMHLAEMLDYKVEIL